MLESLLADLWKHKNNETFFFLLKSLLLHETKYYLVLLWMARMVTDRFLKNTT